MFPSPTLKSLLLLCFALSVVESAAELPTEDPPVETLHPMLAETIEAGPYKASWASLVTHPIPDWFRRDKIGLSAHWGPYAVPGWTPRKDTPYGVAYAEWYMNWLRSGNQAVNEYHRETYNSVPYDEFFDGTKNLKTGEIDGFFTKDFDADQWMKTFKDAGVKYFFLTAKHHDGFCLWGTKYTDRNAVKMGPKRDLLRELVDAARANGIRIGFYYSYYEWYNPIYQGGDLAGYKGAKPLGDEDGDGESGEYVDDFMVPQIKELIDEFHPDYLCFDGEWDHNYAHWRSRQIVAYYYNQAAARGQEVLINDRFGQGKDGLSDTRGVYGDFFHVEYFADIDRAKPWAMWRGFGNSYGYNRNEHPSNILSIGDTIRMMVDVVADNGNVEFNLGPKADGTLADFELERLAAMGAWLRNNGDAIYGTVKSPFGVLANGRVTHNPAKKTLYFNVFDWPENGQIDLPGLLSPATDARLLVGGAKVPMSTPEPGVLRLSVPAQAPDENVSVIAIRYEGELKAERYTPRVSPDDQGALELSYSDATVVGDTLKVEQDKEALGFWSDEADYAEWSVRVPEGGAYTATLELACDNSSGGSRFVVEIDEQAAVDGVVEPTGGWREFERIDLGSVTLPEGDSVVRVRCTGIEVAAMNLRTLRFEPRDE